MNEQIQNQVDGEIAKVKELVVNEDHYGLLGMIAAELKLVNAGIFAILEHLGEHYED